MSIVQELETSLIPIIENQNFELVDIQYLKESGKQVLRIFLDKENGISMDDCEKMSHIIGDFLDTENIINESYVLEISSPGMDRVLKKEKDFKKFIGSKIRVKTENAINNQKNFLGLLLECYDGKIKINDVTNGEVFIEISNIKKANLEVDF